MPPPPAKKWLPVGSPTTTVGYVPAASLPAPSQPLGPGQRTQRLLNQPTTQIPQRPKELPTALREQIREDGTARIIGKQFLIAPGGLEEIRAVCQRIATKHNARLSVPGLKSYERAAEKVGEDYHGDWWSIKDIARLTIVLKEQTQCAMVAREVADAYTQKQFAWGQAPRPQRVIQFKVVRPETSPTGYSGWTVFVRTANGAAAEIQVNIERMIFAKEKEDVSRGIIGDAEFARIKTAYGLPGGMGHASYEIARQPGVSPTLKQEAQRLAIAYNAFFRSPAPDVSKRNAILKQLGDLGLLGHH